MAYYRFLDNSISANLLSFNLNGWNFRAFDLFVIFFNGNPIGNWSITGN